MEATARQLNPKNITEIYQDGEKEDFSLVLGGPLFQLLRKAHLEGDALEMVHWRILVSILITWFPLLILSAVDTGIGGPDQISFFHDIEVHVRFLVAVPILIAAELLVHYRTRPLVRRFLEWRIVLPEDKALFQKAVVSAVKIRNSVYVELALLAVVYSLGLWYWSLRGDLGSSWYELPGGRWRLTPAGDWYVFVCLPLFQFILLRWYMRLFIWFRFLWQVNRIELNLVPTHPDRCGGLSFLGKGSYAFSPILVAQGAILAGVIANRVLYHGEKLVSFKLQIVGLIAFFVVAVLGPLLMFTPRMARVRRKGLADYGLFAQRYVERFDQKWVQHASASEELLGTGDIQSLADLGNSYQVVREMRVVPFGLQDVSRLAIASVVPLAPLLLTVFSFEELVTRVIKVVF
jgi:sterol desaturase/sphingolipid hydroxylase (fatty acid hydroxylase superfamily)